MQETQEAWVWSIGREDPVDEEMATHSSVLGFPGSSYGKEPACNVGASGDAGFFLGWEDTLEEGMATHSSILAWRLPWTEEPGRLQSIGLPRVRHGWSNWAHTHIDQDDKGKKWKDSSYIWQNWLDLLIDWFWSIRKRSKLRATWILADY